MALLVGGAGCVVDASGVDDDEPDAGEIAVDAGDVVDVDGATSNVDAATPMDDCPRVRVVVGPGTTLNIRDMPNTDGAIVGSLPNNAVVTVIDRVDGEEIQGNTEWFEIESGLGNGFVSGAFAMCTTDDAPTLEPPAAYYLPLECGMSATVSQGNNGGFSHTGRSRYAFDFSLGVGTPLVAMADGIVAHTFDDTEPGDPCYDGGGPDCFPFANYVVLHHGDDSGSIYKHLSRVDVTVGEFVPAGTTVGLSGSSGYSTGPHAHVMRQEICGDPVACQSVPVSFADVPGDGVPVTDQTVTSGNCE